MKQMDASHKLNLQGLSILEEVSSSREAFDTLAHTYYGMDKQCEELILHLSLNYERETKHS